MLSYHRKGDNVPQEWYEITEGKKENPFFTLTFWQDCESMLVSGVIHLRTISGHGYHMSVNNANNMNIHWVGGGLHFIPNNHN